MDYWPPKKGQERHDPIIITLTHVAQKEHVIVRTFKITTQLKPNSTPREVGLIITHLVF